MTTVTPATPAGATSAPLEHARSATAVVVAAGEQALITTHPVEHSLLEGEIRFTGDVDEYRGWFAIPGDRFAAGLDAIPVWHLPRRPWTRAADVDLAELGPGERDDLRLAAQCYLFGDARLVRSYRDAIERCYAPFGAAFYRGGRITVEAGARLSVRGFPAIVELEELVVRDGGQVFLHTPSRLSVERLTKLA